MPHQRAVAVGARRHEVDNGVGMEGAVRVGGDVELTAGREPFGHELVMRGAEADISGRWRYIVEQPPPAPASRTRISEAMPLSIRLMRPA